MSRIKKTFSVAAAAVLLAAGPALAQNWERNTKVTFSAPVSLPGVTLPAGTYTFKLADLLSTRHVVHVANADDTQVLATFIAIPAERPQPADETVITFRETPSNLPPAVRFWYYPGETIGREFAYPREQALLIANATGEEVLAVDADAKDADAMRSGELTRVSPASPAEQEARSASDATPPPSQTAPPAATIASQPAEPASTRGQSAPAEPPSAPAQSETRAATETARSEPSTTPATGAETAARQQSAAAGTSGRLPNTASELPLVLFVGLLSLGGALITRALDRSIARASIRGK
jgi:hypothetical protein